MARNQRKISKTGIYHVMMRGNERKNIFIDDEDKIKLIELLENKKGGSNFYLYAYCVMDNHIHLVIREGEEALAIIVKRIFVSYAMYFNKKYKRVGHVFQDRFKSEVVESEGYLLGLIRYVHKNPQKAGIEKWDKYKYSSALDYIKGSKSELIENIDVYKIFANKTKVGQEAFLKFMNSEDDNNFMDIEEETEIDEKNVEEFIMDYMKKNKIDKMIITKEHKEKLIKELLLRSNLSQRHIARVLGVSKEMVRKVTSKIASKEPSP